MPSHRSIRVRGMMMLPGLLILMLVICIIAFPEIVFQSSLNGLSLWWNIVFPALLPFFVLSELMFAFGVIRMLGALMDPLMRLIFRLPGAGGWAIAAGWLAGMPAGAKVTAQLRADQLISREEGNRLLAISFMHSPLWVYAVIAVGLFQDMSLGFMLLMIQLMSMLIIGLLLGAASGRKPPPPTTFRFDEAIGDMSQASQHGFGKVMGESVYRSVQALFAIGGIMIGFSVFAAVLQQLNPLAALRDWPETPLWLHGLLEIHLGAATISKFAHPSDWIFSTLAVLLAWGGWSAHLQVQNFIRGTDLSYQRFLGARLLHATVAFILSRLIYPPLSIWLNESQPTWVRSLHTQALQIQTSPSLWPNWALFTILIPLSIGVILFTALIIYHLIGRRSKF